MLFTPDAQIIHLGGQSSKMIRPQMTLQLRAGILQFIKKHHHKIYYFISCFLISSWFAFRILPWYAISIINAEKWSDGRLIAKTYFQGAINAISGYKGLEQKNEL